MKMRMFLCTITAVLLLFSLIGCEKQTKKSSTQTPSTTQPDDAQPDEKEQTISLQTAVCEGYDLEGLHLEINICRYNGNEQYNYDSRNPEFCDMFVNYLKTTQVQPINAREFDRSAESLYIYFSSAGDVSKSFSINEKGQINIDFKSCYQGENIYEELMGQIKPFIEENRKYYLSTAPGYELEYTIWDAQGNVLEEKTITRTPYLYLIDGGVVHYWLQAGTGPYTRSALFYDVTNGTVSPPYSGQTDSCGKLVSSMDTKAILISDMFSGEELYRIDTFEQPLREWESILYAYFSKEGKEIVVSYYDEDSNLHQQTFPLPENLQTQK